MINLGDKVKDTISGFTGIVTGKTEFLNGCVRVGISPQKLTKDGEVIENQWFDIEQVALVTSNGKVSDKQTGGPRKHNPHRKDTQER